MEHEHMVNIIAVDDERDVKVLFEHFFHDEIDEGKVNLIFTQSGENCLKQIPTLSGKIIVLSDINMPGMNGIELLKSINTKHPEVSVLLISAYDQNRYYDEMRANGAKGYVSKPVDFVALKEMVFAIAN